VWSLHGTPHLCSSWEDPTSLQIFHTAKIPLLRHPVLSQSWLLCVCMAWMACSARQHRSDKCQGSKGWTCHRDSRHRERVAAVVSKAQKEGRAALRAPSATACLAPKSLSEMGQYLLSTGGTLPSLLGLGVIRYCPYFSRQGHIAAGARTAGKLQEQQDHLPVMQLGMLFPGSSSSSSLHIPGQIIFQMSQKLHAPKSSIGSRSDAPMLLVRTTCSSLTPVQAVT